MEIYFIETNTSGVFLEKTNIDALTFLKEKVTPESDYDAYLDGNICTAEKVKKLKLKDLKTIELIKIIEKQIGA